MKTLRLINPDKISDEVASTYRTRHAARGVVVDENGRIAVLPVSKHDYYKLPGGGIEEGEDNLIAFKRECIEEIGSDVEVIAELGSTIEYRSEFKLVQTSYCYVGKVIGERKETAFTEHEMEQGFKQPLWLPFDEAFKLVSTAEPTDYEGKFIKERDTLILQTAKSKIF